MPFLQPLVMALGLAFIPVTSTLVTLWLSARSRAQKAEALVHQLAISPALRGESGSAAQFGQALDAIAVEVERISEGQRFTTKLL
ncbi:MAG: hypothetical protein JWL95_1853, partial [Gemmatimonadetes bacterium]|nr:hypothetical protein [Gemmatimonadota bacterium]